MSPETYRGVVLSEQSESWFDFAHHDPERVKRVEGSKDDGREAPGLPGGSTSAHSHAGSVYIVTKSVSGRCFTPTPRSPARESVQE